MGLTSLRALCLFTLLILRNFVSCGEVSSIGYLGIQHWLVNSIHLIWTYEKGFPPQIPEEAVSADVPPAAVKDLLPDGPLRGAYWDYNKEWWPYREDPNVLLLHYTDARKDLKGTVRKVSKFLDVDLTEDELDTVTQRCSFEHMKKLDRFLYTMPLNKDAGVWDSDKDYIMESGSMTNKARLETGASIFSDKVVARWKQAEEDEHRQMLIEEIGELRERATYLREDGADDEAALVEQQAFSMEAKLGWV